MSYAYATPNEKAMSGVLALAMHVAFFVVMILGVSWQHKRPDSAVVVDLWSALPPMAEPKPPVPAPEPPKPVPPPPRPEPVKPPPEPPKPAPQPPKPAPEPPKPAPEPPKPAPEPPKPAPEPKAEIELKEKLERERREKERQAAEARRLAEEKKRAEEKRLAEEKKRAEAKQREEEKKRAEAKKREAEEQERIRVAALKEQQAKEAAAREQREALARIAAQQAAAQQALIDKYKNQIRDKIRRFIVEPPNLQGNPEVEFEVVVLPGGEVLSARLKKGSGVAAYDGAVERAIYKAQPLPLPPDPTLHKDFRDLNLKFRPKE